MAVAGGWYHVFGRGLERRAIFAEDADRIHFLDLLAEMHERYRILIHAYAQMDNHYHAILQTPDANLSRGMQWLHGSYSAWYNARHQRVGPLFQGRFRAIPVENGAWGYALSLYVHLNPLRISGLGLDKQGRVAEGKGWRTPSVDQVDQRLAALRGYRWSSYRAYAGYVPTPEWLATGDLLSRAHAVQKQRRRMYRQAARDLLARGMEPSRRERLTDAVAIGSVAFSRRVRELGTKGDLRGISGIRELRRRIAVEDVRSLVEQIKGAKWDTFAATYGDWGCALFLWAVRRLCGLTLREAGEQAGGLDFSAASKLIRRLEQRATVDAAIRTLQQRLLTVSNVQP
jgi:REP element-mobilizing transposase RayT